MESSATVAAAAVSMSRCRKGEVYWRWGRLDTALVGSLRLLGSRRRPRWPIFFDFFAGSRQAQECRLYSALAGKGDGQGHRGLLGSVSALQRVLVGNNHLGGRCGGLGCGLVTQATL